MKDYICEFCEKYGYEFYPNYSGRFMYDAICLGIVCESIPNTLLELADYLHSKGIDNVGEKLGKVCSDNLGLDMILYFPELRG